MGKVKGPKGGDGIPQKHLHSRISYLHQAATYLSSRTSKVTTSQSQGKDMFSTNALPRKQQNQPGQAQSRHLLNQLRGVSKKSQIRLARDVKHSICRRCESLLIPGRTSSQEVRNESKGGNKPWADIFEIRCFKCQAVKRFPVGSQATWVDRQPEHAPFLKSGEQMPKVRMSRVLPEHG